MTLKIDKIAATIFASIFGALLGAGFGVKVAAKTGSSIDLLIMTGIGMVSAGVATWLSSREKDNSSENFETPRFEDTKTVIELENKAGVTGQALEEIKEVLEDYDLQVEIGNRKRGDLA